MADIRESAAMAKATALSAISMPETSKRRRASSRKKP
jgi:hypothetical protein